MMITLYVPVQRKEVQAAQATLPATPTERFFPDKSRERMQSQIDSALEWSQYLLRDLEGQTGARPKTARRPEIHPRMPSSTLIPFLGGLGSLINPFKQKRAPFLSLGYWAA